MLINKDGSVKTELLNLVRLQGLSVAERATPRELNDLLQREWVKAKEGVFRAQLGGRFPTEEEMVLLLQLGAGAIPIDFNVKYNGTLLLGATLKAVTRRMWFMNVEECKTDFRLQISQPLYFLGSRRPLDSEQEMPEHILAILDEVGIGFNRQWLEDRDADDWPRHETAVMNRVQCWLGIRRWERVCVLAPDVQKLDGTMRPANTAETVKEWMKIVPPGHYLIVSSQPFCENQKMAVERAVKEAGKEGYTFNVCGPEAPPLPLSRWLDNLAKQLWEEVQLL